MNSQKIEPESQQIQYKMNVNNSKLFIQEELGDCCQICLNREDEDLILIIDNVFTTIPFNPILIESKEFHEILGLLFQFKYNTPNLLCKHKVLQWSLQRMLGFNPIQSLTPILKSLQTKMQNYQEIQQEFQKTCQVVFDETSKPQAPQRPIKNQTKTREQKQCFKILENWFLLHLQYPYPNRQEKYNLSQQTGIDIEQLQTWFINHRKRYLHPLKCRQKKHTPQNEASDSQMNGGQNGY